MCALLLVCPEELLAMPRDVAVVKHELEVRLTSLPMSFVLVDASLRDMADDLMNMLQARR